MNTDPDRSGPHHRDTPSLASIDSLPTLDPFRSFVRFLPLTPAQEWEARRQAALSATGPRYQPQPTDDWNLGT